eukprot:scaffold31989_cov54-Attheya_sp.AAC.4
MAQLRMTWITLVRLLKNEPNGSTFVQFGSSLERPKSWSANTGMRKKKRRSEQRRGIPRDGTPLD